MRNRWQMIKANVFEDDVNMYTLFSLLQTITSCTFYSVLDPSLISDARMEA